jgi:hypothetical protein
MTKKRNMRKYVFKRGKGRNINVKNCNTKTCGGGIYFLGLIGSLVYYIQNAGTFWVGVLGVLKSIVWPAIIVYKLTGFLG